MANVITFVYVVNYFFFFQQNYLVIIFQILYVEIMIKICHNYSGTEAKIMQGVLVQH